MSVSRYPDHDNDLPRRVAFETPRGDMRTGDVLDLLVDPRADGTAWFYRVRVAVEGSETGVTYRIPTTAAIPTDTYEC